MEIITYILLAFIAIFVVIPNIFRDRSPIPETSGNVHKVVQPAELDTLLSSTTNVIVDFYADWCPPCRAIAPIFSQLADKHAIKGHLAFAKVNVDHVNDVAKRYGVTAMPTFVFFEKAKPTPVTVNGVKSSSAVVIKDGGVDRIRGADPKLLTAIAEILGGKARAAAGITDEKNVDTAEEVEVKA